MFPAVVSAHLQTWLGGAGSTPIGYLYYRTVRRKSTAGDEGVSSVIPSLVSDRGVVERGRPLAQLWDIWLALGCRNKPL